MQKALIIALLLTTLSACTATPYGNYAGLSINAEATIADDTAQELTVLYPPASTHFSLSQSLDDAYGMELVKKLREAGYAVQDGGNETMDTSSLSVSYAVDHLSDELNRITLTVGNQTLSRVYSTANDSIAPAGSWTRKE